MNRRLLIIDFDTYIFLAITASKELMQVSEFGYVEGYNIQKGMNFLKDTIQRLKEVLNASDYVLVVGDKNNFRKMLYPSYKSNRPERPEIWYKVMEQVNLRYQLESLPNLEADDTCRIMYEDTNFFPSHEKVIVSVDKDFYSVPCKLYRDLHNKIDKKIETISVEDARKHLIKQIIMGDKTDGYNGIPGYGEVKTNKFITDETTVDDIKQLYLDNGLTLDDYNRNRICATIVNILSYDFNTGKVDTNSEVLI